LGERDPRQKRRQAGKHQTSSHVRLLLAQSLRRQNVQGNRAYALKREPTEQGKSLSQALRRNEPAGPGAVVLARCNSIYRINRRFQFIA
jgi:hypothetical protein